MPSRYQISTVVQKKLKDLNLTAEDVIRKALDITAEGIDVGEGVVLPEGTALLAWYKDEPRAARVRNGAIEVGKERFSSLSGAAASVTGRPTTNGWDWWMMVKLPGKNEFVPLKSFRKSK